MIKTIEGRWGPVSFLLKDEYVGKSLYWYGEYNPDETEKVLSLALAGKLCLDIGANIGCISQALDAKGFEVIAFEPQPQIFELLEKNFLGKCHNTAIGAATGVAKMPKVYYSSKGNFGGLGIGASSIYGSYEVPVRTIDSFALSNVGFIKIDVEGYERLVLEGARETIKRDKPILYIEDDRQDKSVLLRKYICDLGYTIEEHQPPLYREANFFNHQKNVWERNYASHNLICRPIEH